MKIWQISLVILVVITVLAYIAFRDIMDKIQFEVEFSGTSANLTSLFAMQQFLAGNGAVTFSFTIYLTNSSWLKIPIRDLQTRVYYHGQLIGNSSVAALRNIDILPGTFKSWVEPIDIRANKDILGLILTDLVKGVDPELSYSTELRVFGIRYSYSDRVKVIKTTLESL